MSKDRISNTTSAVRSLLSNLQERAKELACLYAVEEALSDPERPLEDALGAIVAVIPQGWQYADVCRARIVFDGREFASPGFVETEWSQHSEVRAGDLTIATITVSYLEERPQADSGPFLQEETKLIGTIADRMGHFALHQRTREMFQSLMSARQDLESGNGRQWRLALDLLNRTDPQLFSRISRKMMNHLCWQGVDEAKSLLQRYSQDQTVEGVVGEVNQPRRRTTLKSLVELGEETFGVAARHLSDEKILESIQRWIQQDKSGFLVRSLVDGHAPLASIADALKRYQLLIPEGVELTHSGTASVRVSLIRRFFTEQLEFINVAKNYVEVSDFFDLIERVIAPPTSHGKLGGKSAGLFLAERALAVVHKQLPEIGEVRTPKTWYVSSDTLLEFLRYNNIEDVYEQKYKRIEEVRQEYPHLVQVFKNSSFPQEIVRGLAAAIDEIGGLPIVVRSSSLLEDRLGSAFSGKYKSLFLANQGTKRERLDALMDAIAEVYASTFGPDPIEYRAERGLLDFNEEMGIMIQQVVGRQVGRYFLPAFAGVAFSRNEFRWSPRIRREDGLVRIVPGLGTRAVDRLTDDYPILAAPGQPKLQVNVSMDDTIRYAPRHIDIINLEENRFQTKRFDELVRELGHEYPAVERVVSVLSDGRLTRPLPLATDYEHDDVVVTFEGLFKATPFLEQIRAVLVCLEEALGTPVDIEFAHDGDQLYLLQCRPQSYSSKAECAQIPEYIAPESLLFSARRYVSNGKVPDITHVVYVSPEAYCAIEDHSRLVEVGEAVSRLNKMLPRRQFILMGPGRWGSRGDIKLGVRVTYSDINNTAMLVEIARKKGNYVPDLSFGTHFFQDLVEASIRYLPLYPDDEGVAFNEHFFDDAPNLLATLLPGYAHLEPVVRVIDVQQVSEGRILRVLMNASQDEAVGILCPPEALACYDTLPTAPPGPVKEDHWRWRHRMAERIAAAIEPARWGVVGLYLFGSTKNATAGPASDIDFLVHFRGTAEQRADLTCWLDGWSRCLDEINFLKTGLRGGGLLDVHIITDEDLERRSSFASKISAITDPAFRLKMNGEE